VTLIGHKARKYSTEFQLVTYRSVLLSFQCRKSPSRCEHLLRGTSVRPLIPRPATRSEAHNLSQTTSSYFVLGGYNGLKSLLIVSKKLTGTTMPLSFRVNAKACSTS
jgi:hypothetical protein